MMRMLRIFLTPKTQSMGEGVILISIVGSVVAFSNRFQAFKGISYFPFPHGQSQQRLCQFLR